jgi:two-component system, NarL family, sensor kinase
VVRSGSGRTRIVAIVPAAAARAVPPLSPST